MHASDVQDTKHCMHTNHSHSGHITITVTTIAVTDDTVYCPPVTSIHFVYVSFLITGSRDQMRSRPLKVVGCLERQSTGPGETWCCVMRSVFYLRKSLLRSVSSHSGGVFLPRPCFFSLSRLLQIQDLCNKSSTYWVSPRVCVLFFLFLPMWTVENCFITMNLVNNMNQSKQALFFL